MQYNKVVEIPARKETVVDFITCDLCGEKIEEERHMIDEVEVRHHSGENWPEGGSGTDTSFDICSDCFNNQLVPWLKSKGCSPQVKEWDY